MKAIMRDKAELKDSGIDGVGTIPYSWEINRVHSLFDEISERYEQNIDNELPLLSVSEYYGVASRASKIKEDEILIRAETLDGYKKCKKGDIVSNIMLAWKCSLGRSPIDGIVSPAYCVYRPRKNVNSKFYHYLFRTKTYGDIFKVNSTGLIESRLRLYTPKFYVLNVPIPSFDEQNAIAHYLDDRCSKIDTIITEAKASIEEYQELKQAVIYEAITKGLDKSIPMKYSGNIHIKDIPLNWNLVNLKYLLTDIVDCPHETPNYEVDGSFYVIRTADEDLGFLRSDDNMYRLNEEEYKNRIRRLSLNKDDIVYGREGERWGLACLVPENDKYCLGQRMMQFRCDTKIVEPRFLMWALNSQGTRMQGVVDTIGSTSPHVNISTIRNFQIPCPSIEEQRKIAKYIDDRTFNIDSIISEKQSLIADLEAYKKSLIYEVVTGKRKVVA